MHGIKERLDGVLERLRSREADAGSRLPGPHSRWSKQGIDLTDASGPYASQRLRNARFTPTVEPQFKVKRSDRLFAIGSCFARGIENALAHRGFEVLSAARDFDAFTVIGGRVTALGFTNKYTTYSIVNEIAWALDNNEDFPEMSVVELADGRCIDPHVNPTLELTDRAGTLERRRIIQRVNARIAECDVVFITLGLIETWYDTSSDVYLNITPTPEMQSLHPGRYRFRVSNYLDNLENLERAHRLITAHARPGLRMIVTTSPVPLQATFTGQDVVVANTHSKATLRAVAQDFADLHDNVQYFPSYEVVMNSARDEAWEDDLRHVKGSMTMHIMDLFAETFVDA